MSTFWNTWGGTELLISLEFRRHYGNLKQNEIQSPYFGNDSFSLFTACLFFKKHDKTKNVHVRITTEGPDKLRVTTISCVDFLIYAIGSRKRDWIDPYFFRIDVQHISDRGAFFVCLKKFKGMLISYQIILRQIMAKFPWMV